MDTMISTPVIAKIDYNNIANTYDTINGFFSMGLVKKWRKEVADGLTNRGPMRILDLACGSGEQILSFFKTDLDVISVNGIDMSEKMVENARKKISKANLCHCVYIENGNACELRYTDNFFDAVTIAFSMRDIIQTTTLLKEAHRVLKVDCPLIILDLNNPKYSKTKYLYSFYMQYIFSTAGGLISGFPEIYKSVWKHLTELQNPEYICKQMKAAGFQKINVLTMFAGIALLINGKKRA
jgi:demethylmenaquinone methyltransferase / 2-methoxy-6-polyprenyl-1,4-benzoquinol methylase